MSCTNHNRDLEDWIKNEDKMNKRIDIIGSNGNEGNHYPEYQDYMDDTDEE
jgi:hypothetical protein